MKVFLLAETKSKILFCLGKQKIFSLAYENNYRYILTCRNKAKEFLLLEKTTKHFLCLGKQSQKHYYLRKQSQRFSFACENKTNILF